MILTLNPPLRIVEHSDTNCCSSTDRTQIHNQPKHVSLSCRSIMKIHPSIAGLTQVNTVTSIRWNNLIQIVYMTDDLSIYMFRKHMISITIWTPIPLIHMFRKHTNLITTYSARPLFHVNQQDMCSENIYVQKTYPSQMFSVQKPNISATKMGQSYYYPKIGASNMYFHVLLWTLIAFPLFYCSIVLFL